MCGGLKFEYKLDRRGAGPGRFRAGNQHMQRLSRAEEGTEAQGAGTVGEVVGRGLGAPVRRWAFILCKAGSLWRIFIGRQCDLAARFGKAPLAVEWGRQSGKAGTWEATAGTQARNGAGSVRGGGPGEGEKQGGGVGVGHGERVCVISRLPA